MRISASGGSREASPTGSSERCEQCYRTAIAFRSRLRRGYGAPGSETSTEDPQTLAPRNVFDAITTRETRVLPRGASLHRLTSGDYSSRMYIPPFNRVAERERIISFIQAHGFATLVSAGEDGMVASHLPVLWDEEVEAEWGTLRSHMARANPQWRHFQSSQEVVSI